MSFFASRRPDGRESEVESPEQVESGLELPAWTQEAVLFGCHGGAGTSTLNVLLGDSWDLGSYGPERSDIGTYGRPLILVCRDTVAASGRATETVTALTEQGLRITALIVVADGAGGPPQAARIRFRLLEERVGGLVHFPFVPALRYVDTAEAGKVALPRKAREALRQIRQLCAEQARDRLLGTALE
ncbi:hypothetical protein ACQEU5_05335 [Marinactinospora thermotolerans]|uniref:Uncharacterized protein n=1 Tax=Marinactinospora thermotolerans DSM 45154 TaxID=1122192 RepID=A0A1T4QQB4_9ACTN|nr:hypothetical protein [Marinactinospora thermotolerans]SKA05885.1 hypothetical protein SAMN02745673_02361 [Marinactinospora thermotolerans DSM 45154]